MKSAQETQTGKPKKTKTEWFIIITLTIFFASAWLLAHWNLSRQPPYHKGPGSPGYQDPPTSQIKDE
tara:strand:- start:128 stop:328 length:201 start_codon:yes stop_codon:yes gene_type:complete